MSSSESKRILIVQVFLSQTIKGIPLTSRRRRCCYENDGMLPSLETLSSGSSFQDGCRMRKRPALLELACPDASQICYCKTDLRPKLWRDCIVAAAARDPPRCSESAGILNLLLTDSAGMQYLRATPANTLPLPRRPPLQTPSWQGRRCTQPRFESLRRPWLFAAYCEHFLVLKRCLLRLVCPEQGRTPFASTRPDPCLCSRGSRDG